jgi:hypothetical protein
MDFWRYLNNMNKLILFLALIAFLGKRFPCYVVSPEIFTGIWDLKGSERANLPHFESYSNQILENSTLKNAIVS